MENLKLKLHVHPCCHFNTCSGCQIGLNEIPAQWKDLLEFIIKNELSLNPKLLRGAEEKWRHRAKLVVRKQLDQQSPPWIGLYREHSHQVVDIPRCVVHHPLINQCTDLLRVFLQTEGMSIYSEETGFGDLRYLQLTVSRFTNRLELVMVLNFKSNDPAKIAVWKRFIDRFVLEFQYFQSVWINFNSEKTNVILGKDWLELSNFIDDRGLLEERICNRSIYYHPASFYQANIDLYESLISDLKVQLTPNQHVLELFSGVGAIGFSILEISRSVHCIERNPYAEIGFLSGYAKLNSIEKEKIKFSSGDALQSYELLNHVDCLIVDPPRKGLGSEFIRKLRDSILLKEIFYVSCNVQSFMHDCEQLLSNGWRLEQCRGYYFFPGTDHIEILASLKRY